MSKDQTSGSKAKIVESKAKKPKAAAKLRQPVAKKKVKSKAKVTKKSVTKKENRSQRGQAQPDRLSQSSSSIPSQVQSQSRAIKTILLTGISGRLGRRMAHRLSRQYKVIGVDSRPCPGLPKNVEHYQFDIRRRGTEDIFRTKQIDAVLHLGVVHNFRIPSEKLYARNVVGTETLLRYISQYNVKKLVLLSSGDVYGPMPTNSHFISEDAPMMASQRFPAVRTMVAVDRAVQSFFWRHYDIETVMLRPTHIVGPNVRNAPSNYFRLRVIHTQLGFDPMIQLIHEDDVLRMLEASLEPGIRGVFNLVGTEPVPLSRILKIIGKPVLPIPHPLFKYALEKAWKYRLTSFPAPELDHIRFNSVLDTSRCREAFKKQPSRNLHEILAPFQAHEVGEY